MTTRATFRAVSGLVALAALTSATTACGEAGPTVTSAVSPTRLAPPSIPATTQALPAGATDVFPLVPSSGVDARALVLVSAVTGHTVRVLAPPANPGAKGAQYDHPVFGPSGRFVYFFYDAYGYPNPDPRETFAALVQILRVPVHGGAVTTVYQVPGPQNALPQSPVSAAPDDSSIVFVLPNGRGGPDTVLSQATSGGSPTVPINLGGPLVGFLPHTETLLTYEAPNGTTGAVGPLVLETYDDNTAKFAALPPVPYVNGNAAPSCLTPVAVAISPTSDEIAVVRAGVRLNPNKTCRFVGPLTVTFVDPDIGRFTPGPALPASSVDPLPGVATYTPSGTLIIESAQADCHHIAPVIRVEARSARVITSTVPDC